MSIIAKVISELCLWKMCQFGAHWMPSNSPLLSPGEFIRISRFLLNIQNTAVVVMGSALMTEYLCLSGLRYLGAASGTGIRNFTNASEMRKSNRVYVLVVSSVPRRSSKAPSKCSCNWIFIDRGRPLLLLPLLLLPLNAYITQVHYS